MRWGIGAHTSSGRCEPRAECMPVFGPRLAREAGVLRIVMVPRRAAPPREPRVRELTWWPSFHQLRRLQPAPRPRTRRC